MLGATEQEAATIAGRGRRLELLKEGKEFDQAALVNSPLFQGRGGPQQFLGSDERAAVPKPRISVAELGSKLPPSENVIDTANIRMKEWADSVGDVQQQLKRGESARTMESNAAGTEVEEAAAARASAIRSSGVKEGSPLARFQESPGILAKAIKKKDSGSALYRAIEKAFRGEAAEEYAAYVQSQRGVLPTRQAIFWIDSS